MYSVLVILAVVAAILLTLIVLIQESKGGGLTSNMAAGNSIMGVHKTTNFVENTTWGLAAALVILSVVTHICTPAEQNADAIVTEMKVALPTLPAAAPALDVTAPVATETPVAPATETQN